MKILRNMLAATLSTLLLATSLQATPTKLFWTVDTTEVVDTGVLHLDVDNYFTAFNRRNHGEIFSPDIGLTFGVFSIDALKAEVGIDYLGGANDPIYFNTKVGIGENAFFCSSPSVSFGVYGVGTKRNRTNFNIFDIVVGKNIEMIDASIYVGGYYGNSIVGRDRGGWMIGAEKGFCKTCDFCTNEEYYQWKLIADYAWGRNFIGGGGVGLAYYFNKDINILTGPVWFNESRYDGTWKWSVQLNFDIPVEGYSNCGWLF